MTDLVFYAALQRCYGIDRKARRCGDCPLLREINCELRMKDETRRRLIRARQEEHRNGRQLTFEDMQTGGENGGSENRLPGTGRAYSV